MSEERVPESTASSRIQAQLSIFYQMDLTEPRALLGYQSETGHQTWFLSKGQSRVELCVSHSEERTRNPKFRAELIKTKLDWPDAREG